MSKAHQDANVLEGLIARCARGDATALKSLFEETSAQLFGVVLRILIRDDLAQEALQDVYLSVWKNADRYNSRKGAPFTWLVSIARYRAIDLKRSRKHEVLTGDHPETALDSEPVVPVPENQLSAETHDGDISRLNECLADLELNQRTAVSMAYLRGLTHREVAEQIRAPIGTVKSWIRRGLDSLRECLQR